ncbi:MAG: cation diffusion facilitator family transporter [Acidobacteriia bacterium]|nr:cation diffusion facilitator family transporter [Terriglobia bacterium]
MGLRVTVGHTHHDSFDGQLRRLSVALGLAAAYMVAEVVGGLAANSLALLADAGHMLTDVAALSLSLFALWVARRPASARRTYGNRRIEVLAALANGTTLIVLAVLIVVEACRRWAQPPAVKGGLLLVIASGGLVVNLISLAVLHRERNEGLNVRGAWLHVLTDALGSVQAIVAGVLISALGWFWADPAASVLIGGLVIVSAWSLVRESLDVLMEAVPRGIDLAEVERAIGAIDGVAAVHDLHVWTITSGFVALSAHVTVLSDSDTEVLWRIREALRDRFGIEHSTIQVEQSQHPQAIGVGRGEPRS